MRGKKVYTYGRPFYSSWGLTIDRHKVERRTRKLSLPELVAGVYILYPRYMNWDLKTFTSPEYVLSKLEQDRNKTTGNMTSYSHFLTRSMRRTMNALRLIRAERLNN